MPTIEDVKNQISSLLANQPNVNIDLLFGYSPAFNHVHELLSENESIKTYCFGNIQGSEKKYRSGKWLIICTEKRLLFLQKSILIFDLDYFVINFKDIEVVEDKIGWFFGNLTIKSDSLNINVYHIGKKDFNFFISSFKSSLSSF